MFITRENEVIKDEIVHYLADNEVRELLSDDIPRDNALICEGVFTDKQGAPAMHNCTGYISPGSVITSSCSFTDCKFNIREPGLFSHCSISDSEIVTVSTSIMDADIYKSIIQSEVPFDLNVLRNLYGVDIQIGKKAYLCIPTASVVCNMRMVLYDDSYTEFSLCNADYNTLKSIINHGTLKIEMDGWVYTRYRVSSVREKTDSILIEEGAKLHIKQTPASRFGRTPTVVARKNSCCVLEMAENVDKIYIPEGKVRCIKCRIPHRRLIV